MKAFTPNALNPGAIAANLQKHTGGLKTPKERQKSVEQGAAAAVFLAASPLLEGIVAAILRTVTRLVSCSRIRLTSAAALPLTLSNLRTRRAYWKLRSDLWTTGKRQLNSEVLADRPRKGLAT